MTKEEAAAQIDGNEYRREISSEMRKALAAAGLVAVFGASDDLMEFDGAIYDEFGAWDGGEAYVTANGEASTDEIEGGVLVVAEWDVGGVSWEITTEIPHARFTIVEDGEPFCRGVVFGLTDVASVAPKAGPSDPLYAVCRAFIARHQIICAEATSEDGVYEDATNLVEAICKIVGYAPNPDA